MKGSLKGHLRVPLRMTLRVPLRAPLKGSKRVAIRDLHGYYYNYAQRHLVV